jgi:alkylated DNA nucleotide flippase Atl1
MKPWSRSMPVPRSPLREEGSRIAEQIPVGSWTTYGDIAKMIGGTPIGVGGVLAAGGITNEHRILNARGNSRKRPQPATSSC